MYDNMKTERQQKGKMSPKNILLHIKNENQILDVNSKKETLSTLQSVSN